MARHGRAEDCGLGKYGEAATCGGKLQRLREAAKAGFQTLIALTPVLGPIVTYEEKGAHLFLRVRRNAASANSWIMGQK
jgi:hypothetical protein